MSNFHFFSGFLRLRVRLARSRGQAKQTSRPVLLDEAAGEVGKVFGRTLEHLMDSRHPDGEVHERGGHAPKPGGERSQKCGKEKSKKEFSSDISLLNGIIFFNS